MNTEETQPEVKKSIKRVAKKKHFATQQQLDSLQRARLKRTENKAKKLLEDPTLREMIEKYTSKPKEAPKVEKIELKKAEVPTKQPTPEPIEELEEFEEFERPIPPQPIEDDDPIDEPEPEPVPEEEPAPHQREAEPEEEAPEPEPVSQPKLNRQPAYVPQQQYIPIPQPRAPVKLFHNDRQFLEYMNAKANTKTTAVIKLN